LFFLYQNIWEKNKYIKYTPLCFYTIKVSFICIFQVWGEYLTQANGDGLRKKMFLFYVHILNVLHSFFILEDLKMSTMAYLGGE